jgi:hypothetical protein
VSLCSATSLWASVSTEERVQLYDNEWDCPATTTIPQTSATPTTTSQTSATPTGSENSGRGLGGGMSLLLMTLLAYGL